MVFISLDRGISAAFIRGRRLFEEIWYLLICHSCVTMYTCACGVRCCVLHRWQDVPDSQQQLIDETGTDVRIHCREPSREEKVSSPCTRASITHCPYRNLIHTFMCILHLCTYIHCNFITELCTVRSLNRWEEAIKRAMMGTQGALHVQYVNFILRIRAYMYVSSLSNLYMHEVHIYTKIVLSC